MGRHAPRAQLHAVTHIDLVDGYAVIRTRDMAPVQGPMLQRIPDDEVALRMLIVDSALHGEVRALAPKAERYLIAYIPRDRSAALERLAEAREELEKFEASLQAKKDRVAKLELDAARHDHMTPAHSPDRSGGYNVVCGRAGRKTKVPDVRRFRLRGWPRLPPGLTVSDSPPPAAAAETMNNSSITQI